MDLVTAVLHGLPTAVVVVVAVLVIWLRLGDLRDEVKAMKKTCDGRLKWCIDHFQSKGNRNANRNA